MTNEEPNNNNCILLSSPSNGTTARATSVLQKNIKLYGPMNALDLTNQSSCWNSDGTIHGNDCISYTIDFHRLVRVDRIGIQFQGGFVARSFQLFTINENLNNTIWRKMEDDDDNDDEIEPVDSNTMQIFLLDHLDMSWRTCTALRFDFDSSTDFYGRITIYQISIWGQESYNSVLESNVKAQGGTCSP